MADNTNKNGAEIVSEAWNNFDKQQKDTFADKIIIYKNYLFPYLCGGNCEWLDDINNICVYFQKPLSENNPLLTLMRCNECLAKTGDKISEYDSAKTDRVRENNT